MAAQDLIDNMMDAYQAYLKGDPTPFYALAADQGIVHFVAPEDEKGGHYTHFTKLL